jgi:hypothetical protein
MLPLFVAEPAFYRARTAQAAHASGQTLVGGGVGMPNMRKLRDLTSDVRDGAGFMNLR